MFVNNKVVEVELVCSHHAEQASAVDLALVPRVTLELLARLLREHLNGDAGEEEAEARPPKQRKVKQKIKARCKVNTHCCHPSDAAQPAIELEETALVAAWTRLVASYATMNVFTVLSRLLYAETMAPPVGPKYIVFVIVTQ